MKCGGTLADRAARLWLARGVAMEDLETTLPKNAMAKKGQVKKRKRGAEPQGGEAAEGEEAMASTAGKPFRRATAGPLMPGQHRRKGQKSLPPKPH